jgi:hypothetical protein
MTAKVDVKGAYIQTEITGSPIYIKMDKRLTVLILSILPSLQAYVTPEGTTFVHETFESIIQMCTIWITVVCQDRQSPTSGRIYFNAN